MYLVEFFEPREKILGPKIKTRIVICTRGKSLLEFWIMYHFSSQLTVTLNLSPNYLKLLVHVLHWYGWCSCDFEINQTKIKGGCQSGRKVVPHNSKNDLPLGTHASKKGPGTFVFVPDKINKTVSRQA